MDILYSAFYIFTLATTLAALEIQIEGKNGWAKDLPTWRPDKTLWYSRTFTFLSSGKKLTGYHIIFFLLIFLIFHGQYAFGVPLTLENEARALSLMFFLMILEDFIWFVINPHFGVNTFFSDAIGWHKKRLLLFPPEYIFIFIASFLVLVPIHLLGNSTEIYWWWLTHFLIYLLFLLFLILIIVVRKFFRSN